MTIVARYRTSTRVCSLTINGVLTTTTGSTTLTDRTNSLNYMGRSNWGNDAFLSADLAGVFVVDEFLSTDATTAIINAMIDGVDLTSTSCQAIPNCCLSEIRCSCNTGYTGPDTGALKGQCSACLPGTYKDSNGTANCTRCPLNSNSSAGSQNITDCVCDAWCSGPRGGPCIPNNSTFNVTSRVHQCSPGFTGPDSTGPCVACDVGTFKNESGPAACALCPPGQYQTCLLYTSPSPRD